MQCSRRVLAFTACLLVATALHAASTTAPLEVRAEVTSNCRIAISSLAFGAYDPLAQHATQQLDAAADVTMLCTRESRVSIYIDAGRNAIGETRSLSGGSQHVVYQLYRDQERTQAWGGGAESLQLVSEGVQKPKQFTLYGRIPPGQEVASGVYTDVVTATVNF